MAGRFAGLIVGLALSLAIAPALSHGAGSADDWEVIEDQKHEPPPQPSNSAHAPAPSAQVPATGNQAFLACGERARAAQEPYVSILATLNHMWNSDARIYESVAHTSPHARTGGCIFYNREYLQMLTKRWMGIDDPDQLEPMLYAIEAHELGHIVHGDVDSPRNTTASNETRELEADRFAGYSLWRLNIQRFDAADTERYYQAIGDDYVGVQGSHGTSKQRVTAFQDGWDQARIGLPENSGRPAGGLDRDDSSASAQGN